MLILLLLLHTLSRNSSLAQENALASRAPVDACDDIDSCRKLLDIIWGCLTTIFACTWVSVHPNVPPPKRGWLALFWRRLKMMLIAVIAPELMVGFAVRQFRAAQFFSKEFEKRGVSITLTHGFFICMGGFVSRTGRPIVTIKQLTEHKEYISAIHDVKAEDINDESKGDALSKGVALLQGLWFVTQCIARISQRLPVTQLEVATLAFAVVNIFIWSLWWEKPLDVLQPIMVGPAGDLEPAEPTFPPLSLWNRFFGMVAGDYSSYFPISAASVPTFWAMARNESNHDEINIHFYFACLAGTIFGGIHCVAWTAGFSSTIEMWMWRSCSLLVAAIPAALGLFLALGTSIEWIDDVLGTILEILVFVSVPLYPIFRLFLVILPLTSLRVLPPGAFIDIDWSVYIPHL
ncbi:hypothetical protein C8R44DRAFT_654325 [Mycena epipterygia]|nr:hypothetical protein C8R44DRAFT_654325 [Mycena epipterygia]